MKTGIVLECVERRTKNVRLLEKIEETFGFDGYLQTAPGIDGKLVHGSEAERSVLRDWIGLLVEHKDPACIVLVGHCDCAGHPVSNEQHEADVRAGVEVLEAWFDVPVYGLLAEHERDDAWPLSVVSSAEHAETTAA